MEKPVDTMDALFTPENENKTQWVPAKNYCDLRLQARCASEAKEESVLGSLLGLEVQPLSAKEKTACRALASEEGPRGKEVRH